MTPDYDYYRNLPRKRVAVGVLIFNQQQELLIVKPTYKDHWSIPGGVVDENESIHEAACREVKEEVGIELNSLQFLVVDYMPANNGISDCLQFIFHGGELTPEEITRLQVDGQEIEIFQFLPIASALQLLSSRLQLRIQACIKTNGMVRYLENGQPPPSIFQARSIPPH